MVTRQRKWNLAYCLSQFCISLVHLACKHTMMTKMGMISNFATGSLSSLFYHCYQIWYKDCLKYENRMRPVGTPFVPPPPHHHHWHYFDITKLPYQKQYPRHLLKSLRKWKFHCWVDLWWSSTIFRMNMTESCLFVNWQGVYDECPSYDGFSHMMCVLPIKW